MKRVQVHSTATDGRFVRRHAARLRVLVTAIAFAGLASAGLAACDTTPSENTAARILPADTQGFATVALSPSVKQKAALFRLSRHFPDKIQGDDKDVVNQNLLSDAVDDLDLDFDADVKPWLGGEAAAAVMKSTDDESMPLAVAVLKVKDQKKAKETFDRKKLDEKQYRFIGDYVAIVEETDLDRSPEKAFDAISAVQKGDADSLNDAPKYKDAIKSLHGEHLALGWFDLPALVDTLDADNEELGYYNDMAEEVKKLGILAFNLYATDSSLVLEAVTEHEGEKRSVTNSELLRRLPSNTLAAVDVNDISDYLRKQLESFEKMSDDVYREMDEQPDPEMQRTYATLKKLADSLNGETVGVVGGASKMEDVSFGAIAQTSDMPAAKAAIADLMAQLKQSQDWIVTEGTVEGGTSYSLKESWSDYESSWDDEAWTELENDVAGSGAASELPGASIQRDRLDSYSYGVTPTAFTASSQPTYQPVQSIGGRPDNRVTIAFSDDKVIIANNEDYAKKLASAMRTSAHENPVDNVGDRATTGLGFIDLSTFIELLQKQEKEENDTWGDYDEPKSDEQKRKDEENEAWARTLNKFSGHTWTEDGRAHSELRLSFK